VIRDRLGDHEDRLFSSVFLGSGLLFLALTFVGAALVGGLLTTYTIESGITANSGFYTYSRAVDLSDHQHLCYPHGGGIHDIPGHLWIRTGVMHRTWGIFTYALALVLLLSISYSLLVTLIFPGGVLVISVYFLIRNLLDNPPFRGVEEIKT
jgi:hypothetical protein